MSVKEYKLLTEALKDEVMILRGDLFTAGIKIHEVTEPKLLAFIPNDLMNKEGKQDNKDSKEGGDVKETGDSMETSITDQKSELTEKYKLRKYQSIVNLDEEHLIMKYCELKAKFDNLKQASGEKINELKSNVKIGSWIPTKIIDEEFNEKCKKVMAESEKKINELTDKIDSDQKESSEQITSLNETIAKLIEENKKLKDENEKVNADLNSVNETVSFYTADIDTLNGEMNMLSKCLRLYTIYLYTLTIYLIFSFFNFT